MKNGYFAFFRTERDFVHYMAGYLEKHPELLDTHDREIRHHTQTWTLDHSQVALGRLGWGGQKISQFLTRYKEVAAECADEYLEDFKDDRTMEYSRDRFERELKQHMGDYYLPEEERYPWLKMKKPQ